MASPASDSERYRTPTAAPQPPGPYLAVCPRCKRTLFADVGKCYECLFDFANPSLDYAGSGVGVDGVGPVLAGVPELDEPQSWDAPTPHRPDGGVGVPIASTTPGSGSGSPYGVGRAGDSRSIPAPSDGIRLVAEREEFLSSLSDGETGFEADLGDSEGPQHLRPSEGPAQVVGSPASEGPDRLDGPDALGSSRAVVAPGETFPSAGAADAEPPAEIEEVGEPPRPRSIAEVADRGSDPVSARDGRARLAPGDADDSGARSGRGDGGDPRGPGSEAPSTVRLGVLVRWRGLEMTAALREGRLAIGRDRANDIAIASFDVPPFAAEIEPDGSGAELRVLVDGVDARLDGEPVDGGVRMDAGQEAELFGARLSLVRLDG